MRHLLASDEFGRDLWLAVLGRPGLGFVRRGADGDCPIDRRDRAGPGGNGSGSTAQVDAGFFAGGVQLSITASGFGDLNSSAYQVNPDGSLHATATGSFSFANPGAAYPKYGGGDGINHFVGGGSAAFNGDEGYDFAGAMSTDTTLSTVIRSGALVGTYSTSPTRADWFYVGTGGVFTIPTGGGHLYFAVNDVIGYSGDNHGQYTVTLASVPEPGTWILLGLGLGAVLWAARPPPRRLIRVRRD